jgi:hypothetical protein
MDTPTILSRSLATESEIGSNRRGTVSGAGWLYALPRLRFERVMCVGAPSAATVAGLARATTVLDIVDRSDRARRRIRQQAAREGWSTVRTAADDDALPAGPVPDLVVVADARRGQDPALAERVMARLAPDGVAYLPAGIAVSRRVAARGGMATLELDVAPSRGEVRSAVPNADFAMRATMRRLGLEGRWTPAHRWLAAVLLRLPPAVAAVVGGQGHRRMVVVGDPAIVGPGVPAYVHEVAASRGRDLTGWDWGVAARGDYDSQKVLVLLRPPGSDEPRALVKVTRSEVHRARLENEALTLDRLSAMPVAAGRAPEPWFAGRHAGRAVLGTSMIDGVPFTTRARWDADCPHLGDAAGWLTELGAATRVETPAATVAGALLALLNRFERVYRPSSAERAALRERFEAVGRIGSPIPAVLQHGDPGIWNLLVDGTGRTVFLDWEAAEPDGLPLWDLLYFVRSYAVAASRRTGVRDRLEAASRHLLDASPLGDRLVTAVEAYRERVGLPVRAVEALIYGCWVHRSLKEASRMAPERVADGQFVRLIRRMLAQPDAPTLARLVGRAP